MAVDSRRAVIRSLTVAPCDSAFRGASGDGNDDAAHSLGDALGNERIRRLIWVSIMSGLLTNFQVIGLHGFRNFDLDLKYNTLVLVGENGSGKTTLLRMLFYFLSGRWQLLLQFNFISIAAQIDSDRFMVTKEQLVKAFSKRERRFLFRFPTSTRERLRSLLAHGRIDQVRREMSVLGPRYGIPIRALEQEMIDYINQDLEPFEEKGGNSTKSIKNTVADI